MFVRVDDFDDSDDFEELLIAQNKAVCLPLQHIPIRTAYQLTSKNNYYKISKTVVGSER